MCQQKEKGCDLFVYFLSFLKHLGAFQKGRKERKGEIVFVESFNLPQANSLNSIFVWLIKRRKKEKIRDDQASCLVFLAIFGTPFWWNLRVFSALGENFEPSPIHHQQAGLVSPNEPTYPSPNFHFSNFYWKKSNHRQYLFQLIQLVGLVFFQSDHFL